MPGYAIVVAGIAGVALLVAFPILLPIIMSWVMGGLLSAVFGSIAAVEQIASVAPSVLGLAIILWRRRFAGWRWLPAWMLAGSLASAIVLAWRHGLAAGQDPALPGWHDVAWQLGFALWSLLPARAAWRRCDGPLLALAGATTGTGMLIASWLLASLPTDQPPSPINQLIRQEVTQLGFLVGLFVLILAAAALIAKLLALAENRWGANVARWVVAAACCIAAGGQAMRLL